MQLDSIRNKHNGGNYNVAANRTLYMDIKQIKEYTKPLINKVQTISETSLDLVTDLIELETYEKGDLFIHERKKNNKEYFIYEGVCRSFLLSPEKNCARHKIIQRSK